MGLSVVRSNASTRWLPTKPAPPVTRMDIDELRYSANDHGPGGICEPQGQLLPDANGQSEAAVVGTHLAYLALAYIVLPNGRMGHGSPLLFELESAAIDAAPAKIKHLRAAVNGPGQQIPIHDHVR